jgi:hypothetical protein
VRRNVKALKVFTARSNFLEHADVFTQVLEVLRSFLEENFGSVAIG